MTDDPLIFAQTWIAAWNSHDLEGILAHYAEDIIFASPIAARLVGTGVIQGKAALRRYWAQALRKDQDDEDVEGHRIQAASPAVHDDGTGEGFSSL